MRAFPFPAACWAPFDPQRSTRLPHLPFPLPLQIHDELIWEVEAGALGVVAGIVRRAMEDASARWKLRVPLPVRMRAGASWGELLEDFPANKT